MTELKSCPFCGGEAKVYRYAGSDMRTRYVACSRCGIGTDRVLLDTAIALWNSRVKE